MIVATHRDVGLQEIVCRHLAPSSVEHRANRLDDPFIAHSATFITSAKAHA